MKSIKIPYGKDTIEWTAPVGFNPEVILPKDLPGVKNATAQILSALDNPIGSKRIEDYEGIETVAIAISDLTRPVPNKLILPPIVSKLGQIGVKPENITVIVGTGLHRVSHRDEFAELIGAELASKLNVISHDATDSDMQIDCGRSKRGTPIIVNKHYLEADLRIVTGMIEPHQFIGFSGGAKGLSIGLGSAELICTNHAMLTDKRAELGRIDGNPAREDVDEIGGIVGIDLIVNVIVNNRKEVVKVVAGHYLEAYHQGVKLAKELFEVPVKEKADLIIASPGGFPKDLNVYQAQKGLAHAARIIKEQGVIILVAECPEGFGDEKFKRTMKQFDNYDEVLADFQSRDFEVGVHKAFLWCKSLSLAQVYLVSRTIDQAATKALMVKKASSIDGVIQELKDSLPNNPRVYVMPKANSTIPTVKS